MTVVERIRELMNKDNVNIILDHYGFKYNDLGSSIRSCCYIGLVNKAWYEIYKDI